MKDKQNRCPLCDQEKEVSFVQLPRHDGYHVQCAICGTFEIERILLIDKTILPRDERWLLSALFRNADALSFGKEILTVENFERLLQKARNSNPYCGDLLERAIKILRGFVAVAIDERMTLDIRTDYPIYFCRSAEDLGRILRQLQTRQWIDLELDAVGRAEVEITLSGVERLQSEGKGSFSAGPLVFESCLDSYIFDDQLGQGGCGKVYKVKTEQDKTFALKLLDVECARDSQKRIRFLQEMELCRQLRHVNIVKVLDSGFAVFERIKCPFYVMELWPGTLQRFISLNPEPKEIFAAFKQICLGLEHCHASSVTHRDLKPNNILWSKKDNRFAIADFGIAHCMEAILPTIIRTESGERLANFYYASPEQRRGEPADHRADVFSLGLMLHEALMGQRPYGNNAAPITSKYTSLGRTERLVGRMLSDSPKDRPQDIREILAELEEEMNLLSNTSSVSVSTAMSVPVSPGLGFPGNRANLTGFASALAAYLGKASKRGVRGDPAITVKEISATLNIVPEAVEQAADELAGYGAVNLTPYIGGEKHSATISPIELFFWQTDRYVNGWNTIEDAGQILRLAIQREQQSVDAASLCQELRWTSRRMNPPLDLLQTYHLISGSGMGCDFVAGAFFVTTAGERAAREGIGVIASLRWLT